LRGCAFLLAAALAALWVGAPLAAAEAPGGQREAYVARAEPICKANVLANKQIFKGVKTMVKKGKLKPASRHFARAARAFAKTIGQLEAVPQPPEYQSKLKAWFGLLRTEKEIIAKIGKALAVEDRNRAESFSTELNHNSNKANNAVLSFGFNYCRIEPSRFG